jgi:tetratricopeptide (TPR) repeat protein
MKIRILLLFLFYSVLGFAQRASEGENYFNNKQFVKAREVYELLLKQKPNDALYNYRFARCCYELKDYENAISHFELSGNKFPLRNLYLGELYFNSYRFDKSITAYQTYITTLKPDDQKIPEYQKKIIQAGIASRLMSKIEDVAIVDSVVVNKADFLRFYNCSKELGKLKQERLKLNSRKIVDKITYSTQRNDRIIFSDSIHGQMDIFSSYKLFDGWSDPVSISKMINTPANENYPFLLLDGVTLYFASDGDNSVGGYDLFVTRYSPSTDTFLKPENIGFPFNSPYNDYMMVIDDLHKIGWFATDRFQPAGKVVIYRFVPAEMKTYIRTDDDNQLRAAAMLKIYRKAVISTTDSLPTPEESIEKDENQSNFVINDSVVYTHADNFKSPEAKKLWMEFRKLNADFKTKQTHLIDLRNKYAQSTTENERTDLNSTILDAEQRTLDLEKQIKSKTLDIRNAENKFLQEHKIP